GLVALALSTRSGRLASRPARIGFAAAAAVEVTIDKLPITPSRLQRRGVVSRVVAGAGSGAWLALREHPRDPLTAGAAALVGGAAALAGAFAGAGWRRVASMRWGRDLPGALAEDLVAASLATVATRR